MTEWEPATEAEAAMRDALRGGDQEEYFRILTRTELLLPVSADSITGQAPVGWGTWTTSGRTHVLAFTSGVALQACLAENAGSARRMAYQELAAAWPNLEWWLAVNPGLPIEGYLPAWFVTQLARGDVRLPGRSMGARVRLEKAESAARARATAVVPGRIAPPGTEPTSPAGAGYGTPGAGGLSAAGSGGLAAGPGGQTAAPGGQWTGPGGQRGPESDSQGGARQDEAGVGAPAAFDNGGSGAGGFGRAGFAGGASHGFAGGGPQGFSGGASPGPAAGGSEVFAGGASPGPGGASSGLAGAPQGFAGSAAHGFPSSASGAAQSTTAGAAPGTTSGAARGATSGAAQGTAGGAAQGTAGGATQGATSGTGQGTAGGAPPSTAGGAAQSYASGAAQSYASGAAQSFASGAAQGFASGAAQSSGSGGPSGSASGSPHGFARGAEQGFARGAAQGFSGDASPGSTGGGDGPVGFGGAGRPDQSGFGGPRPGDQSDGGPGAARQGDLSGAAPGGFSGAGRPGFGPQGLDRDPGGRGPAPAGPTGGPPPSAISPLAAAPPPPIPGLGPSADSAGPSSGGPSRTGLSEAFNRRGPGAQAPRGFGGPSPSGPSDGPGGDGAGGGLPRRVAGSGPAIPLGPIGANLPPITPGHPQASAGPAQAASAAPPTSAPPASGASPTGAQPSNGMGASGPRPWDTPPATQAWDAAGPPAQTWAPGGAGAAAQGEPAGGGAPTQAWSPSEGGAGEQGGAGTPAQAWDQGGAEQAGESGAGDQGASAQAGESAAAAQGEPTRAWDPNTTTGTPTQPWDVSGAAIPAQPPQPPPADFKPANDVEKSLLAAAAEGSTDTFLSTLLLAKVLLPVSPVSADGTRPGEPGFAWLTETIDGEPYVVVFTSIERLQDHLGETIETIDVKFMQLIKAWPDPAWSFAVNPSTAVGAKLPGGQILALANWAADVGLGGDTEEIEPAARPIQKSATPDPNQPTLMQKSVAPSQVDYYLERGYDRVSGFVHRANEVAHLDTPAKMYTALGLSYAGSAFKRDADEIFVLRWPAYRPSLYRIPYGGQNEPAMRAMEGWVIERGPFRGNGFAPSESGDVIAEFKVDSARLPHGAQLWRISSDAAERLVAILDADAPTWRKVGEQ